jgi:biotin transporter BioY
MSEEVLIPKMKRLDKTKHKIKIPILNFVLVIFCVLILIASTFINIEIRHYIIPFDIFSNKNLTYEDFIHSFKIIPQIPFVLFICSVLGRRMALTSVILYILAGLCFVPIFALGGGIKYFAQFGFGYILGYIPATFIAGNLLTSKKYSFLSMITATLIGVLTIHICGILYMIILAIIKHSGSSFIFGWIQAQSGIKILYDIIASFVLVLIGKYLHSGLKLLIE